MKKLNTKGFGAVEILIVLIVIGLVGGVGWSVIRRGTDTKISSSTQQEKVSSRSPIQKETQNVNDEKTVGQMNNERIEDIVPEPTLKMLLGEDPGIMYDNVTTYAPYGTTTLKLDVRLSTAGIELSSCSLAYKSAASKTDTTTTLSTLTPLASQQVAFSVGWHTLTSECPTKDGRPLKAEKSFGVTQY